MAELTADTAGTQKSWWAVAYQALGSALSSRSANQTSSRNTREQLESEQRLAEMSQANQRNILNSAREWDLDDRRYRQESFGNYGQFNTNPALRGTAPPVSPSTFNPIQAPQAVQQPVAPGGKKPKKPPASGLMYFKDGGG